MHLSITEPVPIPTLSSSSYTLANLVPGVHRSEASTCPRAIQVISSQWGRIGEVGAAGLKVDLVETIALPVAEAMV